MSSSSSRRTIFDIVEAKLSGRKIVAVTCYDAAMARLVDLSAVDMVLVGDSVGMVMHGHADTLKVSIDHMVMHTSWVNRVLRSPWLAADLPFMSAHMSLELTMNYASRLVSEGGAQAVKLEGGGEVICQAISALAAGGIPSIGHLGFTPQSVHQFGGLSGYRNNYADSQASTQLITEAVELQEAGASMLVLEMVPDHVAAEVTRQVSMPVIGIGSGAGVDGQILVLQDLLGMNHAFRPKFVKQYCDLESEVIQAVNQYACEVRSGEFPDESHSFIHG